MEWDAVNIGVATALDAGLIVPVVRDAERVGTVSYTHLRAHETVLDLVCRLLLEKKKEQLQSFKRYTGTSNKSSKYDTYDTPITSIHK